MPCHEGDYYTQRPLIFVRYKKWFYLHIFCSKKSILIFFTGERGYFLLLDKIEIRSIQFYSSGGYTVKKLVRNLHQTYAIDYHLGYVYMGLEWSVYMICVLNGVCI